MVCVLDMAKALRRRWWSIERRGHEIGAYPREVDASQLGRDLPNADNSCRFLVGRYSVIDFIPKVDSISIGPCLISGFPSA